GKRFDCEFLAAHNTYRQQHGAEPLRLNQALCKSAQSWAEHMLATKTMQHSSTSNGENLYYTWSSTANSIAGSKAVESWYSEIKDYNFRNPGFGSNTGHFTQVVWKSSKELGVGKATDGKTMYVVGHYSPAGNITNPGYFQSNVLPPGTSGNLAQSSVSSDDSSHSVKRRRQSGCNVVCSSLISGGACSPSGSAGFEAEALEAHNMYRQQHGAPPLRLSAQLSREAQKWASQLLSMHALQHSNTDHGENIWCRTSSVIMPVSGKEVVETWYNEIKDYDFNRPGFQKNTGHFTQVVWRDSRELGIALATDSGLAIAVARYDPGGNITNPGYFQKNVLPKGARPAGRDPDLQSKSQTQTVRVMVNKPETVRVMVNMPETVRLMGSSSSSSVQEQFSQALLKKLNDKRQQHGAGPLRLSPTLSKEAQDWAEHLIQKRVIQNHPGDHGQSMWYQTGTSTENPSGSEVAESWYSECSKYDFSSPGFQTGAGNFSQMVWKCSTQVGIGLATDRRGMFIAVAFYDPPGNIDNRSYFRDNVLPRGSRKN
ncbi:GAPR1 protein, partial [Polyodon spathula]|nr:GAPR1 protein [Polyodon spathula]